MLTNGIIFMFIVILLLPVLVSVVYRRVCIEKLKEMVQTFDDNYEAFRFIIDRDLEIKEIVKEMIEEMDVDFGYPDSKIRYLSIDFGTRDMLGFRNTSELRRNFLIAGDFIQKYTDFMKEKYQYDYEQDVDYGVFLESLRNIRRMCMRRGEETNVDSIVLQQEQEPKESY